MQMTTDEIAVRYRQAADKSKQIRILAELNACEVSEIKNILRSEGIDLRGVYDRSKAKKPAKKTVPEPASEITIEAAFGRIRAEIDELNRQATDIDIKKRRPLPDVQRTSRRDRLKNIFTRLL